MMHTPFYSQFDYARQSGGQATPEEERQLKSAFAKLLGEANLRSFRILTVTGRSDEMACCGVYLDGLEITKRPLPQKWYNSLNVLLNKFQLTGLQIELFPFSRNSKTLH